MTAVEKQLLESLVELERTVAQMAHVSSKPNLLPIFARIEDLARALPRPEHAGLLHFLQNKSYQKAREHLEAKQATAGASS